jgi:hypothetical protein
MSLNIKGEVEVFKSSFNCLSTQKSQPTYPTMFRYGISIFKLQFESLTRFLDFLQEWTNEIDESQFYFSPEYDNVLFASAIDGWGFG